MTRLSCRNGYSYSSSDITDRMICARDANKDSCQVATHARAANDILGTFFLLKVPTGGFISH